MHKNRITKGESSQRQHISKNEVKPQTHYANKMPWRKKMANLTLIK